MNGNLLENKSEQHSLRMQQTVNFVLPNFGDLPFCTYELSMKRELFALVSSLEVDNFQFPTVTGYFSNFNLKIL